VLQCGGTRGRKGERASWRVGERERELEVEGGKGGQKKRDREKIGGKERRLQRRRAWSSIVFCSVLQCVAVYCSVWGGEGDTCREEEYGAPLEASVCMYPALFQIPDVCERERERGGVGEGGGV